MLQQQAQSLLGDDLYRILTNPTVEPIPTRTWNRGGYIAGGVWSTQVTDAFRSMSVNVDDLNRIMADINARYTNDYRIIEDRRLAGPTEYIVYYDEC
jgi:hypothetical protein